MLYLLDASVLIDAQNRFYPRERIPEFWSWLVICGEQEQMKIPFEIYEEIRSGKKQDPLDRWLQENKKIVRLDEIVDRTLVNEVKNKYASDLTDDEMGTCGCDPFLIAYALYDCKDRIIVTNEVSKPSKKRARRHIPDVCNDLGIRCCKTWQLIKELDFKTSHFPRES